MVFSKVYPLHAKLAIIAYIRVRIFYFHRERPEPVPSCDVTLHLPSPLRPIVPHHQTPSANAVHCNILHHHTIHTSCFKRLCLLPARLPCLVRNQTNLPSGGRVTREAETCICACDYKAV